MITLDVALDILKVAVGLVYLYFEYHARKEVWIVGMIMPAISLLLFFNKGLYADFAINIYYLIAAVYGFAAWSRRKSNNTGNGDSKSVSIASLPILTGICLAGIFGVLWLLTAYILYRFTDSNVVWLDSFTTSLSIIGLWMMARRYYQQWIIWFVVDAVYVWLYYYKGIYFSGTLYMFYTVMAILGLLKWKRMMQNRD